LTDSHFALEI